MDSGPCAGVALRGRARRSSRVTIAVLSLGLACGPMVSLGRAADDDEVRTLREEVEQLREEQQRSEARIDELEARDEALTIGDIDDRIEAFDDWSESRLFLAGYGTASFVDQGGAPSTFDLQFNPSLHFRMLDELHFNAELEFQFENAGEGTTTEVGLEFGSIDYLATDWLTISAGKLLLPFNTFGPRYHPGWINKLASPPPIYGGHHGAGGLIPVLSDVGIMASGGAALWSDESKLNYAIYVVNGPTVEAHGHDDEASEGEDGEAHDEGDDGNREAELLGLAFDNIPDDTNDKAVGGRIGFLPIPNLEIGGSVMVGRVPGPGGQFDLYGADLRYWTSGLEIVGELIYLDRRVAGSDPSGWGYYGQAAYRLWYLLQESGGLLGQIGRLEPVIRWGAIEDLPSRDREQLAFGLNYWLFPSVPVRVSYEINDGAVDEDRFFAQVSYGF